MLLRASCYLEFDISVPTPFIFMLRPRSGAHQWIVREEYQHTPSIPVMEFADGFGYLCQRLTAPPGNFSVRTSVDVTISNITDTCPQAPFVDIALLPESCLGYLLPSRYCESDKFLDLANDITFGCVPGYDQVSAIDQWIRRHIKYETQGSEQQLSANETYQRGYGVCRDFAHIGISLCRSISIPARLVVGYLYELEPMELHAWFEAYVGGRWYTFDPTQDYLKGGYIPIGYGKDAADVAVFNQFGPPCVLLAQEVSVEQIYPDIVLD
jgi:transglutaminase-like putative cysteine protease